MTDHLYVSLQDDDRVLHFVIDPDSGELEAREGIALDGGPAPLAVDPTRRHLYVGRRRGFLLSSLSIDPSTGDLAMTGTVKLPSEPCYLSTDHTGRFVLSAYYQAGHCAVHPIDESGAVGGEHIEWLATGAGAHCFQTDPSNQYAFLPHIASGSGGLSALPGNPVPPNAIYQFRFDEQTGRLTPNDPRTVAPDGPDGPRHYCFHPTLGMVYVSNEQGSSVTAYAFDTERGTLRPVQTLPTLPDGFSGRNACSQIQLSPSGHFLYAPNRGHNSIASFVVDAATGELSASGWAEAEAVPRAFSLDPGGGFLYAAGLATGNLVAYRVDDSAGTLTRFATYEVGARPMWVLTTTLP
ncbi:MAG: beta-propeller fold lactonase family protein [Dehalococcoidia bacterium]